MQEMDLLKPKEIVDLACGEGFFEQYLIKNGQKLNLIGVDISFQAVAEAKNRNPQANFLVDDVLNLKLKEKFDLALMLELLEHLSQPEKAIASAKKIARRVIISVPWEPWFSWLSWLGGKHFKRFGKHPEHCQFFNKKKLQNLLDKHFPKVEIKSSGPWLIAVCQH